MKKSVTGVAVALMLIIAVSGAAYAADGVEFSAGAKIWAHTLKSEIGNESETSDTAILIGPVVGAKFSNNIFIDASFLTTVTKYKFDAGDETSRTDIDLAVGYSFIPNLGVYVGYRNSEFSDGGDLTISGPLFGVRGSAPISDAFSVYGNLAYLMFENEYEGGSSEDAPGFSIEAGLKYAFMKNLEGGIGYRWDQTEGDDYNDKLTFSGVTLDLMYKF